MSTLARLLDYGRGQQRRALLASCFSVLNKLFDIAPEILIGVAVDVVVKREQSWIAQLGVATLEAQLVLLGVVTVAIWAGESAFQYLYQLTWRNLAQQMQHQLRTDVYRHLQNLEMSELDRRRQGELQTLLTEDVNQLERFLNAGVNDILQVITSTLAVSVVFMVMAPQVAVFAMLPIPVIVLVAFWFQRGLGSRYASVRQVAGQLGARLTSQLHGLSTIKAYTAHDQALLALRNDSERYVDANRRAIRLSSAFVPLIRMAVLSGFVVTLVYGGLLTLEGSLAVGAYSVLVFLTQRLLWPFTRLGETVDLYQRSMASTARLLDILTWPAEPDTHVHVPVSAEPSYRGDIRFDQVTFTYPGREAAVRDVSLTIAGDSFVGLVGSTGSGKSTLIKLLLRFYAPQQGAISIDGVDIRALDLHALRRHIGLVSQDLFLFHGTLHENIALGAPQATRAEVIAAAEAAELGDLVRALPQGFDTLIGDFGSTLSGGQRQRLAIARAILKAPPILVLDEATSAVDNETEAAIQRSIARLSKNRTVIAIAHRLSTVRHADNIIVLESGRIVESGTHASLVASGGPYERLWSVQVGEGAHAARA